MFKYVRQLCWEENGTSAVEYAIMLALILMGCIVAISSFGAGSSSLWNNILDQLNIYMGN